MKALNRNDEALVAYRRSLAIHERRLSADPSNPLWQRDRSVMLEKIGDILVVLKNIDEALVAYKASLEIRIRLAAADPNNVNAQRDVFVAQEKLGDVFRMTGRYSEGLDAYSGALAAAERLIIVTGNNREWQRLVSKSHLNVGDMITLTGNLAGAEARYQQVLASCADVNGPTIPEIADVMPCIISLWRIGTIRGPSGQSELELAFELMRQQSVAVILNAEQKSVLQQIEQQVARLRNAARPPSLNSPAYGQQQSR
jgi:tetratricopeptide (TPR) repeat protein